MRSLAKKLIISNYQNTLYYIIFIKKMKIFFTNIINNLFQLFKMIMSLSTLIKVT